MRHSASMIKFNLFRIVGHQSTFLLILKHKRIAFISNRDGHRFISTFGKIHIELLIGNRERVATYGIGVCAAVGVLVNARCP